jgi:protein phosphatase
MKVVIISDLHANVEALAVLPREYDELWVLGDLVNYGPNPAEVVEFVRSRAKHVVRGNQDEFLGWGDDPRCPGPFRELATVTGEFTRTRLTERDNTFLRELPLQMQLQVGHTRFWLCHAMPSDPLYGYGPPESEGWNEECVRTPAEILLVGHSHMQFMKKVGDCLLVNPGSPRIETIWRALRSGKTEGSVCVLRSMRSAQRSRKWEPCLYRRPSRKIWSRSCELDHWRRNARRACLWQTSRNRLLVRADIRE